MHFIIDTVYSTALILAMPYLLYKMVTTERYRAGLFQRLGMINGAFSSEDDEVRGKSILSDGQPSLQNQKLPLVSKSGELMRVWIHCASVGEVLTAKSLISEMEKTFPNLDILISTNTNTGYSVAQQNYPNKFVFYCPLDFSWIMRKVFKVIMPDCVMLMELEIWPNFLLTASERNIPIILLNGRITEKYEYYRKLLSFSKNFFENMIENVYCVQNDIYAERLKAIRIPESQIRVTGSVKFDNIITDIEEGVKQKLTQTLGIVKDDLVIVGGSTHPCEEEILVDVYKELRGEFKNLRLIIVPRHIERTSEISRMITAKGFDYVRKTELVKSEPGDKNRLPIDKDKIIIVDTVGELVSIYSIASCVFVGKSLSSLHGGHNMLEPAGLGKPVLFGPHTSNFEKEADMLLAKSAAIRVNDGEELREAIRILLREPSKAGKIGDSARKVVLANKGATARHIEIIKEILEQIKQRRKHKYL